MYQGWKWPSDISFPTELIKLPISYVDEFSKMSDSKNKKDKVLKIIEFIWIITHNSQPTTLCSVSTIKGKCKIKQKKKQIERWEKTNLH